MKHTIGNVGSPKDSTIDYWRIDVICDWLYKNDLDLYNNLLDNKIIHDNIDLTDSRDFLKEDHTYTIVVLHGIYNPIDFLERSRCTGLMGAFNVSSLHRASNWVCRLRSTHARYLFTFGDYDEVSYQFLGHIDGYEKAIACAVNKFGGIFYIYKKQ